MNPADHCYKDVVFVGDKVVEVFIDRRDNTYSIARCYNRSTKRSEWLEPVEEEELKALLLWEAVDYA